MMEKLVSRELKMTSQLSGDLLLLGDTAGVSGTLVWYYFICKRQVWLMSRNLNPDEEHERLAFGRALHELAYSKKRKEIVLEGVKLDVLMCEKRVVCEVKTSSRHLESAKFQLAYYLHRLREQGLDYSGELRIPLEKKRFKVFLDSHLESRLAQVIAEIKKIISAENPEPPLKNQYCKKCAYKEFCWA